YVLNDKCSYIFHVGSILRRCIHTESLIVFTNTLPYSIILIPLLIISYLVFSATTFDSASLILASVASKKLDKAGHPPRYQRMFWALVLGAVGITVIAIGGLDAVQLSSGIIGVPMLLVFVLMTISFLKAVNADVSVTWPKKFIRKVKVAEADTEKENAGGEVYIYQHEMANSRWLVNWRTREEPSNQC